MRKLVIRSNRDIYMDATVTSLSRDLVGDKGNKIDINPFNVQ